LVGKPNAGKSTLLSRLSRAHPEIASYPFTTKHPNLGQVMIGGERAFILADLPGLIEGAHQGVGLGHEFLRHVERTLVIIHVLEPFPMDQTTPLANYHSIRNELDLHGKDTILKPEIIVLSKSELTDSDLVQKELEKELGKEIISISAVTGQGLATMIQAVTRELRKIKNPDE
jgi:GTP-binding protein